MEVSLFALRFVLSEWDLSFFGVSRMLNGFDFTGAIWGLLEIDELFTGLWFCSIDDSSSLFVALILLLLLRSSSWDPFNGVRSFLGELFSFDFWFGFKFFFIFTCSCKCSCSSFSPSSSSSDSLSSSKSKILYQQFLSCLVDTCWIISRMSLGYTLFSSTSNLFCSLLNYFRRVK